MYDLTTIQKDNSIHTTFWQDDVDLLAFLRTVVILCILTFLLIVEKHKL